MILDPWQREALEYDGDLLLCTGRRVGKTYILAIKSIEFMLKRKLPVIIFSLTEDQAMIILQMALQYARERCPKLIGEREHKPKTKELTLIIDKKPIELKIRPVGNSGDAARGFEAGAIVIDEASRMPKMFWIAAKPLILTMGKGQIWMGSTPNGKEGYFWERFNESYNRKDPDSRFHVIYTNTEKVMTERPISKDWTQEQREGALRILEEDKREMSNVEWQQEYGGLFMEELHRFFDDLLIEKCCVGTRDSVVNGKNYLGCDIARLGEDESTFEIITDPGVYPFIHRENIVTKKTLTTETERRIINTAKAWNVRKVGIDAGAGTLGVSVLDHLRESEIRHKVVPLNNREIVIEVVTKDNEDHPKMQRILKADMYYNLLAMMEKGEIILLNDTNVKLSFSSVQHEFVREKTQWGGEGSITNERIFGKYTHIVEGIIRAAWLAKKEKTLKLWADFI